MYNSTCSIGSFAPPVPTVTPVLAVLGVLLDAEEVRLRLADDAVCFWTLRRTSYLP